MTRNGVQVIDAATTSRDAYVVQRDLFSGMGWEAISRTPMLPKLQNCINLLERNNSSHVKKMY